MNEFIRLLEMAERGENIYYHMTMDDHGPVVEFIPRRPQSACTEEPDDPRICVSPSLAGCMVAGTFSLGGAYGTVHVYATHAEAEPISSDVIFDADVTEEHWITEPAIFVLVDQIDLSDISSEAKNYQMQVYMPYESPISDRDLDLDDDDGRFDDYINHMQAKEEVEKDLAGIADAIHGEAKRLLTNIVPRVKDIPGQGLFYFADASRVQKPKDEELEEAEDKGRKKIPSIPAPGNFHQVMPCVRDEDEEQSD